MYERNDRYGMDSRFRGHRELIDASPRSHLKWKHHERVKILSNLFLELYSAIAGSGLHKDSAPQYDIVRMCVRPREQRAEHLVNRLFQLSDTLLSYNNA